jgi:hypothetical protein
MTMKSTYKISTLLWIGFITLSYSSEVWAQAMTLPLDHRNPAASAFEKIYINPKQLVGMPDGLYYFDKRGYASKVGTVLHDCRGTYVLKIEYQCPLCGRVYLNKAPDEDHGCPLFMEEGRSEINFK